MDFDKIAENVAEELLDIKAVFLRPMEPFTWASGIHSPIYCDNRLTLSYPKTRKVVEQGLADVVRKFYPDCEVLMGTSTAGIPHAAYVSDVLDMPMGYVRSDNKSHGRENRIEGVPPVGKKVVVIEDLISTAGSSVEVVKALRDIGADVLGIASIFTYTLRAGVEKLKENDVENHSLSNIDVLVDVAVKKGYISKKEKAMVLAFIANPQDESWRNVEA